MKKILLCLLCCMMALTACQAQTGKSSQIFADNTAMRAAVRSKWWVCEADYGEGVKYYKVLFFNDNDLCLWWTLSYAADSSLESCMQYVLQLENVGGNKYNGFADFFINCKTSGGTKKTNTLRRGYYAVNYVSERNAIYKGDEALGAFLSADRFQSGEDVYRPEEGGNPTKCVEAYNAAMETITTRAFGTLPTWKDVRADPYSYAGEYFFLIGSAELDDYYNYGFRNTESIYFCIQVIPQGGSFTDRWFIYGKRSEHGDLLEKLKEGLGGTLVMKCGTRDVESLKEEMAVLTDYYIW